MSSSNQEGENWACPLCGNSNYPSRTHCNMRKCRAPRPSPDAGGYDAPPAMYPGPVQGNPYQGVQPGHVGAKRGYGGGYTNDYDRYGGYYDYKQPYDQHVDQRKRPRAHDPYVGMGYREPPFSMPHMPYYADPRGPREGRGGERRPAPRVGDWTCPQCGNINFPSRTHCNIRSCGAPRPADQEPGWTCFACKNVNYAHRTTCNMRKCAISKEESERLQQEAREQKNRELDEMEGVWICPNCNNRNYSHRQVCNMRKCKTPKPSSSDGVGSREPISANEQQQQQ